MGACQPAGVGAGEDLDSPGVDVRRGRGDDLVGHAGEEPESVAEDQVLRVA